MLLISSGTSSSETSDSLSFFKRIGSQENQSDCSPEERLDPISRLEGLQHRNAKEEDKDGEVGAKFYLFHLIHLFVNVNKHRMQKKIKT